MQNLCRSLKSHQLKQHPEHVLSLTTPSVVVLMMKSWTSAGLAPGWSAWSNEVGHTAESVIYQPVCLTSSNEQKKRKSLLLMLQCITSKPRSVAPSCLQCKLLPALQHEELPCLSLSSRCTRPLSRSGSACVLHKHSWFVSVAGWQHKREISEERSSLNHRSRDSL